MAKTVTGEKTKPRRTASARQAASGMVPSRRQYLDLKNQYPHAILLYRLGDFYEAFDDDAGTVAKDARITLTSRNFGRSGRVPMAGIPHHALNHYLGRLLAVGHTIAIAEQISEPGRGLVERAVTRVLTPGTVSDSSLLPESENRYLASVLAIGRRLGLAWVDVSTGEFAIIEFDGPDGKARLHEELARLNPAECLVPNAGDGVVEIPEVRHQTRLDHWHFEPHRATDVLQRHFHVRSLDAFGCTGLDAGTGAAGAILAYLGRTDKSILGLLTGLKTETADAHVGLDEPTRRNLELTRSIRSGGRRGTLLDVVDVTRTAMGARTLRRLIGQPLRDLAVIQERQAMVAALVDRPSTRAALRSGLTGVGDLERLVGRVGRGTASLRDVLTLGSALRSLPAIVECLRATGDRSVAGWAERIDPCSDVLSRIQDAVEEDRDGVPRLRPGFSPELDRALEGTRQTREWLAGLERTERDRTGIRSLKVGFNKVFGYYLEVTRPNLPLVPDDYIRKQTVATGERYVTAALKEAEARILAADEAIAALEREALVRLTSAVAVDTYRLIASAGRLALLDALLSLAEVAHRDGWVRPELSEGDELLIIAGRHPVVEAGLGGEAFIPNDCALGAGGPRMLLVTGPNMGGKSTYLRQAALIVVLAQIGSFVPASKVRLGLVDRLFTRVGAHDDLAGGASTFMVEMTETAAILHQATRRSFVILDEVGRGTSTQDGLAIARAVLEDLHGRIGARTLFATHFLDLTTVVADLPGVANAHVAALETDERVIFLYAVRPGAADRAYGVHVARLAGLPRWVADRADELLNDELDREPCRPQPDGYLTPAVPSAIGEDGSPYQLQLDGFPRIQPAADRFAHDLLGLDIAGLTPREAVDWLFDRQARLRGGS